MKNKTILLSPISRLTICFSAGIFFSDKIIRCHNLISWHIIILLILFIISILVYRTQKNIAFGIVMALFSFISGSMLTNKKWIDNRCSWKDTKKEYHGRIRDEIIDKGRFVQFIANIEHNKVLIRVMKDSADISFKNGDLICFYGMIKKPQNTGNPYEMDYATYLFHNSITGTTFLQDDEIKVIGHTKDKTLFDKSLELRHNVISIFRRWGVDGDELALLSALIVGERNLFSQKIEDDYTNSGLAHMLSISGMHVGILLLIINSLLWFMKGNMSLRIIKWIILSISLWIFAYISGLAPSAVRAVVMCILLEMMYFSHEKRNPLNIIFVTALCMLIYNPFYLFDISFQLSFAAVISIILFYSIIMKKLRCRYSLINSASSVVALSISAQIGAAPLVLYYFSNFSTYFLLSNILSSFLVILIMAIALLLFVIPLDIIQTLLIFLLRLQNNISSMVASLPNSVLRVENFSVVNILLFYIFSIFALLYLLNQRRKYAIVVSIILLLSVSYNVLSSIPPNISPHAIIYSDSKMPYIHFVEDRKKSYVISPIHDTLKLHPRPVIKKYCQVNRISIPSFENDCNDSILYSFDGIILWHGKRFCILCDKRWNKRINQNKPLDIDYLYFSRGYYKSISYLQKIFNIKKVIIGSSLSDTSVETIIKECAENEIPFVNLKEIGYYKIMI